MPKKQEELGVGSLRHCVPSWKHTDRILRNQEKERFLSPFCSLGFSGQCNCRTRCFRSPETFLHTAALRLLPRAVSVTPPLPPPPPQRGRRAGTEAEQPGSGGRPAARRFALTPTPSSSCGLTCTLSARFRPKPCHCSSPVHLLSVHLILFLVFS